jgi:peptidoglycan/xylan/chitin deacetylase (PgdA/CDA1 family)
MADVSRKPIASLSFDLDDKWSYLKTHGDASWRLLPTYLDVVVPRALELLRTNELTITFFAVGQDAALARNRELLEAIVSHGHEVGNHSYHHEPWLHLYSPRQIQEEIAATEMAIERATGYRPVGFRGPGFSISGATLEELARRKYLYDATAFPTIIVPAARLYYFLTARFTPAERARRKTLGGTFRDGLRPIKPYTWRLENGTLVEIPITTVPGLKMPFHLSYLVCLSLLSRSVALHYFKAALQLCRWAGIEPSIVVHPTDLLGIEDTRELPFIPGMGLQREKKLKFVSNVIEILTAGFEVVPLRQHAARLSQEGSLPAVCPIVLQHG